MAGAVTISEIRQWMNDTFVSKVEDQLNREILAVELFKKHNTGFTDGQAIVPINYARNNSAGYRGENGTLPNAGELGRARLAVDAKYLYSRMSLTGPAIESGRNNPNGLKATLQEEIDGALESLSNRCNNYMFSGGGCIGYIMRKNANLNAAADFFGNAEHLPAFGGAAIACRLVRMDTYALITAGATTIKLTAAASSATSSAEVILGAGNSAGIPDDVPIAVIIDQAASYADVSAGGTETVAEQPMGIMSNLSTESHFGVDRTTATATWASLQSSFNSASPTAGTGAAFASSQLQTLLTKIQRLSDKRPEMFFVEHGFMDQYISVLTTTLANGNFRINQTAGKGADAGFNTQQMSYGGVPFRASRNAPKGCVIALTPSTWAQVTLKSPGMADLDGSVLSRESGLDAWEAFARYYHNLCCKRPNANGILVGVAN
jgi:hypothetical protein